MGNSLKCIIKLHLILLEHRSRVTQLGLKLKIIDSFGYKQYINWINFGGYTINWGYTIKSSKGNREQKIQSSLFKFLHYKHICTVHQTCFHTRKSCNISCHWLPNITWLQNLFFVDITLHGYTTTLSYN